MKNYKETFMRETYKDSWMYYKQTLEKNYENVWDWVVVTASNDEQAEFYESEISSRKNAGLLPQKTKFIVVADIKGKRIGSGGATLNVIKRIREEQEDFGKLKILVLHSGGDSKRIPQYSASGKLFAPIQRTLPDGRSSTIFDEILISYSAIPSRMQAGMLILSGDVLFWFSCFQVNLQYVDSAAISTKATIEEGICHGVFVTDKDNNVEKFLHKQPAQVLKSQNAVNKYGFVDIDTGVVYFNSKIVEELYNLISENGKTNNDKFNEFANENVRISLYNDFVYVLSKEATLESYLKEQPEGKFSKELIECRKKIWNRLGKYTMKVIKTYPSKFIHLGTNAELLKFLNSEKEIFNDWNLERNVLCNIKGKNFTTNTSYIDENTVVGDGCYIEHSKIMNCKIGKNSIISNTELENVVVPSNVCINTLKQKDGKYVTRIWGIEDNAKKNIKEAKLFGNSIKEKFLNIDNNQNMELWNAKLYVPCDTCKDSVFYALQLYNICNGKTSKTDDEKYFCRPRVSLGESFENCDINYLVQQHKLLEVEIRSLQFIKKIMDKQPLEKNIDILLNSPDVNLQIENLQTKAIEEEPYVRLRIYMGLELINKTIKKYQCGYFENMCYDEIEKMISQHDSAWISNKHRKESTVEMPIRVNFGGGWSDTPPYCNENGGSVLNAAFLLNGKLPIRCSVKEIKDSKIILRSIDLNIEKEFKNIEELKDCGNINDEFILLKSALVISGVIRESDKNIKDVIQRIGCGICLETDVTQVPKGSGLGTSSILAGACIKAIYQFFNVEISDEKICYKVLEQEQLMETCGGWQDQIGGILPGIKYTRTEAGKKQKFNIESLQLSEKIIKQINERMVLIYTGQQRIAKNLLREIMNDYIINNENTCKTISKIKMMAGKMKKSLEENNLQEFCKLLNEHWKLSKKLDAGCTNTCIDQILNACDDLIDGRMICGAGGGGFLQVVMKQNVKKEEIADRISKVFQESGIQVYNVEIWENR